MTRARPEAVAEVWARLAVAHRERAVATRLDRGLDSAAPLVVVTPDPAEDRRLDECLDGVIEAAGPSHRLGD